MEKLLKPKLPMVQLLGTTGFTRREAKRVQTALLPSLLGQEGLHTGILERLFSKLALLFDILMFLEKVSRSEFECVLVIGRSWMTMQDFWSSLKNSKKLVLGLWNRGK